MNSESLQPPCSGMNSRSSPFVGEAAGRRAQHQRLRAVVAGAAGVLEEQQVRRERGLRRTREAVLRAIQVRRQQARDVVLFAESQPADEGHRGDVVRLGELAVRRRAPAPRRARAAIEPAGGRFPGARSRRRCGAVSGLQESRRRINPPRRNPADVDDDVLRQRVRRIPESGPATRTRSGACVPTHRHSTCDSTCSR